MDDWRKRQTELAHLAKDPLSKDFFLKDRAREKSERHTLE